MACGKSLDRFSVKLLISVAIIYKKKKQGFLSRRRAIVLLLAILLLCLMSIFCVGPSVFLYKKRRTNFLNVNC